MRYQAGGVDTRAGPERVPGRILDMYWTGTGAGSEWGSVSHEQASSRCYFDARERAAEAWSAA